MRIGHGYDAHRFVADQQLVLGGVDIPYEFGLLAHSDGDVVLHALCDALLGATGLGDIGQHFPDTDANYENIDSRILLRRVAALLDEKKVSLLNADITIIAQAPKLASYLPTMANNIASDLKAESGLINLKATTTEGMGFAGRKEGIEVHAVVLLKNI
jgi:2-C-methyl-D-erythritol 2,4-cyclodiphosphate synthase